MEFDQAGRALSRGALPNCGDHRKALFERVAGGDGQLGAMVRGQAGCRLLKLGRAHVGRGRIDQVAHFGGGRRKADVAVDLGGLGGEQDARAAFGRVVGFVAGEAVLAEQPAQRGGANLAIGQPVMAGGKRLAEPREAPWGKRGGIGDRRDDLKRVTGTGQDRELAGFLAVEIGRREQRSSRLGLVFEPFGDAVLVDKMDRVRGLAAIGLEKGGKIGHVATI